VTWCDPQPPSYPTFLVQVSRILFEVLKLPPPPCAKDLKSGGFSTGQEVGQAGGCSRQVVGWFVVQLGGNA